MPKKATISPQAARDMKVFHSLWQVGTVSLEQGNGGLGRLIGLPANAAIAWLTQGLNLGDFLLGDLRD